MEVLLTAPLFCYVARVYLKITHGLLLLGFAVSALPQVNSLGAVKTPAHQALERFRRGVNFGNYLEAPRNQNWGARYSAEDLDNVKKEGFDHVRLPIAWHNYTGSGPEFQIEPELFGKVDLLVTYALARGLAMLINIHHFDELTANPHAQTNRFYAIWRQIAEHYADQPAALAFELLNEPKDAATTEIMNPIYEEAVRLIRKSNPKRTIFLGPSRWNSLDEVPKLRLPKDDNIIVTVHCYDPFLFTHQGASWTMPETATVGLAYPGPPPQPVSPDPRATNNKAWNTRWFERYNILPTPENPCSPLAFVARIEKVADWSRENNVPIHLGEFGAYIRADAASRARFYTDMRKTAERLGFGWAIWDWKAGFRYWDNGKPAPGLREALFDRP